MRIGVVFLVTVFLLLTLTSPLFFGSPVEAQPQGFLEDLSLRTQTGKVFVNQSDPDVQFSINTFTPLHYRTDPDVAAWDAEVDLSPRRVINGQFDGWLVQDSGWHYALGSPGDETTDGWVGFGGRRGAHFFEFRLSRVGYLHWPVRAWDDLGGAPTYNRVNLASSVGSMVIGGESLNVSTTATWSQIWTTPSSGSLNVSWTASGDGLKEEIVINQAAREWLAANRPPSTPASETYFGFVLRLDWSDVPKVFLRQVLQDVDLDWSPDGDSVELRDAADRLLALLPVGKLDVVDSEGDSFASEQVKRRFWRDPTDGLHYLLLGVRVDILNALPAGDLVFDPTVDVMLASGGDDCDTEQNNPGLDCGRTTIDVPGNDAGEGDVGNASFRFANVNVPQGAVVTSATFEPYTGVDGDDGTGTRSRIYLEADDNATVPVSEADFDGRNRTVNFTAWDDQEFTDSFTISPDIGPQVQEVLNRSGWQANASMQVFWQYVFGAGAGFNYEHSTYDAAPAQGAKLHITFTAPPTVPGPRALPSVKDSIDSDTTTNTAFEDVDGLSVDFTVVDESDILLLASIQATGSVSAEAGFRFVFDGSNFLQTLRQVDGEPGNILITDLVEDKAPGTYTFKLQHKVASGTLWTNNTVLVAVSLHDGTGAVPTGSAYVASDTVGNAWEDVPGLTTDVTLSRTSHIWALMVLHGFHSVANKMGSFAINIDGTRMEEDDRDWTAANEHGAISLVTRTDSPKTPGTYTVKGEWKGFVASTLTGEDFKLVVIAAESGTASGIIDIQKDIVASDTTTSTVMEDIDGLSVTATLGEDSFVLAVMTLATNVSVNGASANTTISFDGADQEEMERGHALAIRKGNVGQVTRPDTPLAVGTVLVEGRWRTDSGNTLTGVGIMLTVIVLSTTWFNEPPSITNKVAVDRGRVFADYSRSFLASDFDTNQTLIWTLETNATFLLVDSQNRTVLVSGVTVSTGTFFVNVTVSDLGCSGACALTDFVNYTVRIEEELTFFEQPDTIAAIILSALAILFAVFALKTRQRSIAAISGVVTMLAGVVWVIVLSGTALFAALIGTVILAVGLIMFLSAALGRRRR